MSSFPVPVSPVISTVASVGATLSTFDRTDRIAPRNADDRAHEQVLVNLVSEKNVLLDKLLGPLSADDGVGVICDHGHEQTVGLGRKIGIGGRGDDGQIGLAGDEVDSCTERAVCVQRIGNRY